MSRTLEVAPSGRDFSGLHASLESYVDGGQLPMAASVILEAGEVIDVGLWGDQDREAGVPIALDSIYRIYSNTKLITSIATMILWEEGHFDLDDPAEIFFPDFARLEVLRSGATSLDEVEPLQTPPTIRQLFSHSAGFSYGLFPESVADAAYVEADLLRADSTLEALARTVADIPLATQPGTRFQYSVGTDLLARLIEIVTGDSFESFLMKRIFEPLDMPDTGFHVPAGSLDRLCANYVPLDARDSSSGVRPVPDSLVGGFDQPKSLHSGGGGLVSTIIDYTHFVQMLMAGGTYQGQQIVEPATLDLMRSNQLPEGKGVDLPAWKMPDTVFGLGFALKLKPAEGEPATAIGEYHWGGAAGTHTFMNPQLDAAGLVFTQRLPGFWDPFSHAYKREFYRAFGG